METNGQKSWELGEQARHMEQARRGCWEPFQTRTLGQHQFVMHEACLFEWACVCKKTGGGGGQRRRWEHPTRMLSRKVAAPWKEGGGGLSDPGVIGEPGSGAVILPSQGVKPQLSVARDPEGGCWEKIPKRC